VTLFAREEFGLKHRYAMVLHTDQAHPHVHLVVKSIGHDGRRLNIRHSTLRIWRREFARQLRAQGVAANATERVVLGVNRLQKTDGIYRAARRGESTHWDQSKREVAEALKRNGVLSETAGEKLRATRRTVLAGWSEIERLLTMQGREELAKSVHQLTNRMEPALTDREFIASRMQSNLRDPAITQKANVKPEVVATR
jgi:type IV secretory pathway VirD2 relaxase